MLLYLIASGSNYSKVEMVCQDNLKDLKAL